MKIKIHLAVLLLGIAHLVNAQTQKPAVKKDTTKEQVYFYKNDTLIQEARIMMLNANTMAFNIRTINSRHHWSFNLMDTAHSRFSKNADQTHAYDDENGSGMYGAIEYYYEKQCNLTIGIEVNNQNRLFITQYPNCNYLPTRTCPYQSAATLRKLN